MFPIVAKFLPPAKSPFYTVSPCLSPMMVVLSLLFGISISQAQSFIPIFPANSATNIGLSSELKVSASVPSGGNITVTFYGREIPSAGSNFTLVALPDTQYYVSSKSNGLPQMFYAQTDWIVTNRQSHNIPFVAQLGDCVESGDLIGSSQNNTEWRNATNALYRLENPLTTLLSQGIPYGVAVGNHDQEPNGDANGTTTHYNQYFGSSHFGSRTYYGGHYGTNNDNYFDLFSASGMNFIAVFLEYDTNATPAVLTWANNVLQTNANRRAIVISHYIGSPATPSKFGAQGAAIYNVLKTNANLFLMLCGHVNGEGSRQDVFNGHTVTTLVSDFQFRTNGGNGFMRLMKFSPSNNLVSVTTYSPWLGQYETDADSQFSFSYNMDPGTNSFRVLNVKSNELSGSIATADWPGRQLNHNYEWCVTLQKDSTVYTGPTWRFTTAVTNTAPVASNLAFTLSRDAFTNQTVIATDINGDVITFRTNSIPTHGLLSNFNPATGVFNYRSAHGYSGPDSFTFAASDGATNSALATVSITVLSPTDANGNGIPDNWEATYGITDPNADADGDGVTNLKEYWANTNPTNAASVLRVIGATNDNNGRVTLVWASVGGTRYRIQYCDSEPSDVFTDIVRPASSEIDPASVGTASTQTFVDDFTLTGGAPTGHARFYRIKVVQ